MVPSRRSMLFGSVASALGLTVADAAPVAMPAADGPPPASPLRRLIDRLFREHRRYTGDGLPGEPAAAPLPIGDAGSGRNSPTNAELRAALGDFADGLEKVLADTQVVRDDVKALDANALLSRDQAQQYAADAAQVSGVNVPIYASVASARSPSRIAAGVREIRTQFHSPTYSVPATLRGGARYVRVSKAVIDAAGYPATAYFRSADRNMPDGTVDTTGGGYWLLNEQRCSPDMFGARLDGKSDDTRAANDCAMFCCLTGREFVLPRGLLRLTDTLDFGKPVYTSLAWLHGTSDQYMDYKAANAAYSPENVAYNSKKYRAPTIFIEGGSAIIADFVAESAKSKAVFSYNFYGNNANTFGLLVGAPLQIGTPLNVTPGGWFNIDYGLADNAIPDNGLIGAWFPVIQRIPIGAVIVCNMGFAGVAAVFCYQAQFTSIYSVGCGDGAILCEHNSGTAFVTANYCNRGVITHGDSLKISIGTQQCKDDIVYIGGDTSILEMRYIEDYNPGAKDGNGAYCITLGREDGRANQARFTTILGARLGTVRPGKGGIKIRGGTSLSFMGLRVYSKALDIDELSSGAFINTDVEGKNIPAGRFTLIAGGSSRSVADYGLGQRVFEGSFRVKTPFSIALPALAGISGPAVVKTVTLPQGTVPEADGPFAYQSTQGDISWPSASYAFVIGKVTGYDPGTRKLTLTFMNTLNSQVVINQGFLVAFKLFNTRFLTLD